MDIQLVGRYVIINQSISTIQTASRCKKIDLLERGQNDVSIF